MKFSEQPEHPHEKKAKDKFRIVSLKVKEEAEFTSKLVRLMHFVVGQSIQIILSNLYDSFKLYYLIFMIQIIVYELFFVKINKLYSLSCKIKIPCCLPY